MIQNSSLDNNVAITLKELEKELLLFKEGKPKEITLDDLKTRTALLAGMIADPDVKRIYRISPDHLKLLGEIIWELDGLG
ncbi:hypothetical protein [Bacillus subtilis]|uniref:hypothetical protein n=1 Tax=Bacillus subtilis TaxID=1423 RepID=UPI0025C8F0CE|nr:hypothetical protein [Bacillus subtilis]GLI90465.1 hypothetical protein ANABIO4_38170 [Bacillus subtilis]